MRNGGKKWSGSRSDAILFFFQREMEERFSRVEKAEEWEQQYYSFSSSSSKRRRRQRRRRRRSRCNGRTLSRARRKKEELCYSPDAFSPKNSRHEISQRRSKNIFARTNRKRPKTRERERKSFLFSTLFHTPNVCCFYIRTILHARFYANATF